MDCQPAAYSTWYKVAFVVDALFRFGIINFSFIQLTLVSSAGVVHCIKEEKALAEGADWLKSFAIAQLILIPLFIAWRHVAVISGMNEVENGKEKDMEE